MGKLIMKSFDEIAQENLHISQRVVDHSYIFLTIVPILTVLI